MYILGSSLISVVVAETSSLAYRKPSPFMITPSFSTNMSILYSFTSGLSCSYLTHGQIFLCLCIFPALCIETELMLAGTQRAWRKWRSSCGWRGVCFGLGDDASHSAMNLMCSIHAPGWHASMSDLKGEGIETKAHILQQCGAPEPQKMALVQNSWVSVPELVSHGHQS